MRLEAIVSGFGPHLRQLRIARGWRQQDLVDALDGQVARSTIANVETGREPPTPRLWNLLVDHLEAWAAELDPAYQEARHTATIAAGSRRRSELDVDPVGPRHALGGPFVVELLQLVYVFRHSRSPEEVLETRRVRATRSGADGYGLKVSQTDTQGFRVEEEALWGGYLADQEHLDVDRRTLYLRRVEFGKRLRKGQTHEFAVRSWIQRDPAPGTSVGVNFTIPAQTVAIHLNFYGPEKPVACWSYGPIPDAMLVPPDAQGGSPLSLTPAGTVSLYVTNIAPGSEYGIAWRW